jgi:hypothetical protein
MDEGQTDEAVSPDDLYEALSSEDEWVRMNAVAEAATLPFEGLRRLVERCLAQDDSPNVVPERRTVRSWLLSWLKRDRFERRVRTRTSEDPTFARRVHSLVELLTFKVDPGMVGLLLTLLALEGALPAWDQPTQIRCWKAIGGLLPQVDESTCAEWTVTQRATLVRPLLRATVHYNVETTMQALEDRHRVLASYSHSASNPAFRQVYLQNGGRLMRALREPILAILQALQRIGDERELGLVRGLAGMEARTPISREIQRAAEESLPFIELRAHKRRQAQSLLRPAQVDPTGEQLWRPMMGTEASFAPDEMLHLPDVP